MIAHTDEFGPKDSCPKEERKQEYARVAEGIGRLLGDCARNGEFPSELDEGSFYFTRDGENLEVRLRNDVPAYTRGEGMMLARAYLLVPVADQPIAFERGYAAAKSLDECAAAD